MIIFCIVLISVKQSRVMDLKPVCKGQRYLISHTQKETLRFEREGKSKGFDRLVRIFAAVSPLHVVFWETLAARNPAQIVFQGLK